MPVSFDAMTKPVRAGECRLFIGVRSDPFFADGEGAFHDFQFTGDDTFAGKNILSMALEVPDEMLGPGPEIAVWATVSVRRDGTLVQVDRYGNPSFNPFFVDELQNQFNAAHPADDVADFLEPWSTLLESRGYPPAVARETALTVLPDVMHYNRTRPAHYPNGRVLTDDVYDMRMAFLTYGQVTSDGVEPHDDYMTEFLSSARRTLRRRARTSRQVRPCPPESGSTETSSPSPLSSQVGSALAVAGRCIQKVNRPSGRNWPTTRQNDRLGPRPRRAAPPPAAAHGARHSCRPQEHALMINSNPDEGVSAVARGFLPVRGRAVAPR
jgi:hypothetical protein